MKKKNGSRKRSLEPKSWSSRNLFLEPIFSYFFFRFYFILETNTLNYTYVSGTWRKLRQTVRAGLPPPDGLLCHDGIGLITTGWPYFYCFLFVCLEYCLLTGCAAGRNCDPVRKRHSQEIESERYNSNTKSLAIYWYLVLEDNFC